MLRTFRPNFGLLLLGQISLLLAAALTPAVAQPNLALTHPTVANGNAALAALGPRIAEVAQFYGFTAQKLNTLLQTHPSLGVDRRGALIYTCAAPNLRAGTTPANALVPGSSTVQLANGATVDAFQLHSLPGASKVIYLDFTGHTTADSIWNASFTGGTPIVSAPFDLDGDPATFSAGERAMIIAIWKRVTEDYAPFAVDVTTQDPGVEALRKTSTGDQAYGIRVVISPTNWYNLGAGGVGYVGSFNWDTDTPVFVFTQQLASAEKYIAEAASHEVGHSLGLNHDGLTGANATEYYGGQGDWAPIMGVSYYRSVTQFSKGEYANANNLEDDLAIISTYIPYATDDHGNTTLTASTLTVNTSGVVSDGGTIERSTDVDVFRLAAAAGPLSLNVQSPGPEANLKLSVDFMNAAGAVLETANAAGTAGVTINRTVTTGTYYLRVRGIGEGDPVTSGYSSYGSIGNYLITGNLVPAVAPIAVASATPASGLIPLTVNFSSAGSNDPDGTIVSYAWDFGNGATSTAANPSNVYTIAGSYTATLTVTDNMGITTPTTVAITASAPTAPQITTQPTNQTVNAGATVTFTAAASGNPAPTFQWQKNSVNLAGATNATLTLAAVTAADAGSYTLVATNSVGSTTSNAATLSVNVAPQITMQPASQTVNAGATVTFTAAASGTPTPTYRWRKNSANLAGATNASLTLSAVTAANAGSYTLVATNAAGSATSNAATLSVNANIAPQITTQPVSQTVNAGATVTFTAATSGTPTPTFQWQKNGANLAGATNATLTLSAVTAADAGSYTLVATNAAGSATSNAATLTVNATGGDITSNLAGWWKFDEGSGSSAADSAGGNTGTILSPAWTTGPVGPAALSFDGLSSYVNVGSPPALNLAAANQFTLSAWVYPTATPNGAGVISEQFDGGADTSVQYELGFDMDGGAAGEARATVGFYDAANGGWHLAKDTVNVALNTWTFITGTWDGTTLKIYKNGSLVNSSTPGGALPAAGFTNVRLGHRHDTYGTHLFPGKIDDPRIYGRALSPADIAALFAYSGANVAPQITTQPVSQTVNAGATVTFTAAASGTPTPTFQWQRNSANLAGATNASLTLTAVTAANAGSYTVVATNAAGSATSNAAVLTVNPVLIAPQITTQPVSQTVNAGATVTFTAAASGNPTPTFQWQRNSANLAGATNATLTLTAVTAANAGSYTVVATNAAGSATSNAATLTVNATGGDITTALIHHWRMDEGTGALASDSAGSAHGTLVNGPSWVPGKIGPSALGFSAAAASHVVASQPSDAPYLGALTIAAWINVTPGGGDAVVASKVSANGAQNNPFDFIVGSGGLYFVRANGSYCAWLSTATSGSGWHHVAVVAPDANVNTPPIFYLDGVALGTVNLALNSGGPATGDGSPIRLGRRADGAGQLTGSLDDVRLYSRALSPADLAALFAYAGSPSAPQFTTQPGSQ